MPAGMLEALQRDLRITRDEAVDQLAAEHAAAEPELVPTPHTWRPNSTAREQSSQR